MLHHYVPCFYTKRWIGADRRLCQYSRPHSKVVPKRVYPAGTGYVDNLYAIPQVSEDKKHLLETKFMRQIDQKASDILQKLEVSGLGVLTSEDRLFWATFLISLRQRNPEKVAELAITSQDVMRDILNNLRDTYPSRRTADDPATFDELLQRATDSGYFERAKVLLLQDTILLPRTAHLISSFHWGIRVFEKYDHKLLTSDRPVVMTNGLGTSYGHIALPLGPRTLFFAARTTEISREILSRPRLDEATNNEVARQAQRYVYGTDDTQLLFVERRLRRKNVPISN